KRVERFLWFALPCDDPKCPVCNFLAASKPFVSPGKKNRSGKATFYDAIDVPTEHVGLLVFRMPDRVHAEFPKDKRMLTSEILEPQQVPLEITLVVEVHVKTAKISILRQQIFGRGICRIRKESIRIDSASDPDQFLYKFNHSTRAEPPRHGAGNFVADQVTKNCRVSDVRLHGS